MPILCKLFKTKIMDCQLPVNSTLPITGIIYDIKKYAIHDGPGFRTTVFMKGCPLDCWWCHNPESRDPNPQARGKMRPVKNMPLLDNENNVIGVRVTTEAVLEEIRKDILFFDESGGGVTFSGGEPLLQPKFLQALLKVCKQEGIHTVVDTTGLAFFKTIEMLAPYVDLFLYDIKLLDDALHQKYTGVSNKRIVENLLKMESAGYPLRIRIPLIPEFTDSKENLESIALFLKEKTGIREVELLPYNSMGESKYERLGLDFRPGKHVMQTEAELERKRDFFLAMGFGIAE